MNNKNEADKMIDILIEEMSGEIEYDYGRHYFGGDAYEKGVNKLLEKGYGDKEQAVKEFAEKLQALPLFEEMYPDEQVFIGDVKSAINELIIRLYGVKE